MNPEDRIPQKEVIDLLNKCWMTHDGMWFFHCLAKLGIEETNRLNKAAIQSLSRIEIKRIRDILGDGDDLHTFEGFRRFFRRASTLVIPDFMNVTFGFPGENQMTWEFEQGKCFAYAGIKRLNALDRYECGVLYRIQCWLDALEIPHRFAPEIGRCHMHRSGTCSGTITLELQSR